MPMKILAASKLLKFVVKPAHMLEKISSSRLTRVTGLRPKVFANGTHHKLEKPSIKILTAARCVNVEKGLGGRPKIGDPA